MAQIYEPMGRAREYSPLAYNFFKGCTHGCKYCYVTPMFKRYNAAYNHADCKCNLNLRELEQSARKLQGCNKQILLSFTGDPYCGIDPQATKTVLQTLNRYRHKVAILTKGGARCLEHLDVFKEFGDRIKVGATLTFDNEADSREWEPGAASPSDRLDTLRTLHENGIKTWVSFEPVIVPTQSLAMLNAVATIVDHVKIGKLNNYMGLDRQIDWAEFLASAVKICRDSNLMFYVKHDLRTFATAANVNLTSEEIDQDFLNL